MNNPVIDREVVDHVAELARLGLSEEERERLGAELARILDYVRQLSEVPPAAFDAVSGVPVMPGQVSLRLRPDHVTPSLSREAALANAPEVEAGFVKVPPILE